MTSLALGIVHGLWAFAKANWKPLAIVAVVVAVFAAIWGYGEARFNAGVSSERKAEAARVATAQAGIAKHEAKAQAITDNSKAELDAAKVQIRTLTAQLQARSRTDVPPAADTRCVINLGFVRAHDAAALGVAAELSGPSGGPVEAPSGVQLSEVLSAVEGNYGVAYEWRAEAIAWRDWYAKQKAAWDER